MLITGGGGVLGAALQRQMPEAAMEVFSPSRSECDLLDSASVRAVFADFKPQIVFHLAGKVSGILGNISYGGVAFYENTLMNLNVIEAARISSAERVIAAGTTAIYSDLVNLPMREQDLWLGPPHGSEAPYANAKRAMLAQLSAYQSQYGLEYCFLICTNLFGSGDRFDVKNGHVVPSLIARFFEAASKKAPSIAIWGDGSPTRDFLHADDAARAFIAAVDAPSGAYNVATGRSTSIRTLVECLVKVSGYKGEIVWDASKPNGQLARSYDVSKIHSTGWKSVVSLEEGLSSTFSWYAANHELARRG
ncbi:MAG: NAD-dependent epimerase/dehydratase family protein [Polynucleobacter sp.]|nr:NAD-dependent epimerase/dehydratase family protein [Polynucleobacter sp.]